jgi:hypothetical protein
LAPPALRAAMKATAARLGEIYAARKSARTPR